MSCRQEEELTDGDGPLVENPDTEERVTRPGEGEETLLTEEEARRRLLNSFEVVKGKSSTSIGEGINNYVSLMVVPQQDVTYSIVNEAGVSEDIIGRIEEDPAGTDLIGTYYIPGTASDVITVEVDNGYVKKQLHINVLGELSVPTFSTVAEEGENNLINLEIQGREGQVSFSLIPGEHAIGSLENNVFTPPDSEDFIRLINLVNINRDQGEPFHYFLPVPIIAVDENGNSSVGEIHVYPRLDLDFFKKNSGVSRDNLYLGCRDQSTEVKEEYQTSRNVISVDIGGGDLEINFSEINVSESSDLNLKLSMSGRVLTIEPPDNCSEDKIVEVSIKDGNENEETFSINLRKNLEASLNLESRVNSDGSNLNQVNSEDEDSGNSSIENLEVAQTQEKPPLEMTILGGHPPFSIVGYDCDNGMSECRNEKSIEFSQRSESNTYNVDGVISAFADVSKIELVDFYGSKKTFTFNQMTSEWTHLEGNIINLGNPFSIIAATPGDTKIEISPLSDYLEGGYHVDDFFKLSFENIPLGDESYSLVDIRPGRYYERGLRLKPEYKEQGYINANIELEDRNAVRFNFQKKVFLPYSLELYHFGEKLNLYGYAASNGYHNVSEEGFGGSIINAPNPGQMDNNTRYDLVSAFTRSFSVVGGLYWHTNRYASRRYYLGQEYFMDFHLRGGYDYFDIQETIVPLILGPRENLNVLATDHLNDQTTTQMSDVKDPSRFRNILQYRESNMFNRHGKLYKYKLSFDGVLAHSTVTEEGVYSFENFDRKVLEIAYDDYWDRRLFLYSHLIKDNEEGSLGIGIPGFNKYDVDSLKDSVYSFGVKNMEFHLGGAYLTQNHKLNFPTNARNISPSYWRLGRNGYYHYEYEQEGINYVCRSGTYIDWFRSSPNEPHSGDWYGGPDQVCFEGVDITKQGFYLSGDRASLKKFEKQFDNNHNSVIVDENFGENQNIELIASFKWKEGPHPYWSIKRRLIYTTDAGENLPGENCSEEVGNENLGIFFENSPIPGHEVELPASQKVIYNYFPQKKLIKQLENNNLERMRKDTGKIHNLYIPVNKKNSDCTPGDLILLKISEQGQGSFEEINLTQILEEMMGDDFNTNHQVTDVSVSKVSQRDNKDLYVFVAGTIDSAGEIVNKVPFLVKYKIEDNGGDDIDVSGGSSLNFYEAQGNFYKKYSRIHSSSESLEIIDPRITINKVSRPSGRQYSLHLTFDVRGKYYGGGSMFPNITQSELVNQVATLNINFVTGNPNFFRRYTSRGGVGEEFFLETKMDGADSSKEPRQVIVRKPLEGGGNEFYIIHYSDQTVGLFYN